MTDTERKKNAKAFAIKKQLKKRGANLRVYQMLRLL